MFDSLSEKLGGILDRLTRRGALSEADVDAALREVRRALLEADVALDVARAFTDNIKKQAVGVEVMKSVTPGQMVVKIVHDQLVATLGADSQGIDLAAAPPVAIMMVGLQGSGKTTTTAKLARRLTDRQKRKVLMASLDVRRPAAMEQLAVLGREAQIDTLPVVAGQQPPQIAKRALEAARLGGYDVVLLDTAGRTTLDDEMMNEAAEVKRAANPHEVLLVADALTGQDAVNLARAFDQRVGLTGIVLTRVDGDGRGGAALSMRAVTNKPIKLIGTGEKMEALEEFDPARIAGRILGMGDIVALVEKAAANIDAEKAMRAAEKMRKGKFDLADLREQLQQMQAMGGMGGLLGMMPGVAKMKAQIANAGLDDKLVKRQMAIIELDDAAGTPQPRHPQSQPQEAHRRRLRHDARIHQQAFENASRHGRHDEGHGRRQARPARRPRTDHGLRLGRRADAGADGRDREKDAGRRVASRNAGQRAAHHAEIAAEYRGQISRLARPRQRKVSWIAGSARFRKKEVIICLGKEPEMSLVIRMARAGTKKRPVYHIVVADSRSPRDGRFIERLGHFNPLLPKDKTERLKLDLEKVQAWMKKGAQPSDRVMRFLDAAGIAKREKRNNPEKAIPRKERKAAADEALKAKEAGDAAAKTAATAKAAADKAAAAAS